MASISRNRKKLNEHPRDVAKEFGVHLRTIFRWVGRGWLVSKKGRIVTDYRTKILPDWKRSIFFMEAKSRLRVAGGTLMVWKKNGIVEAVKVFDFVRISRASVGSIIKRRRRGTFSSHPTHVFVSAVLNITGLSFDTVKRLIEDGEIQSSVIDGTRMIPIEEIERIAKIWNSSCPPIAAKQILGRSRFAITAWMNNGRLRVVEILGKRRVLLKGLAKTSEQKERLKIYLKLSRKKFRRRVNSRKLRHRELRRLAMRKHLRAREREHSFRRREFPVQAKRPIVVKPVMPLVYTLTPVSVEGYENRRLTTCEEAAKALGRMRPDVVEMCSSGLLRAEVVGEDIFPYISSVEAARIRALSKIPLTR